MPGRKRIKTLEDILKWTKDLRRKQRLAVAAAADDAVLKAVSDASREGVVTPVLIGDEKAIKRLARSLRVSLKGAEIVNTESMADAAALAVKMCRAGEADILMKGRVSTDVVFKAVLDRDNGVSTGGLISHVAVFHSPAMKRLMLLTDAAINISPDVGRKAEIISNAVIVAGKLGIGMPKVALLAAVEKINFKTMPATTDAAILVKMNESGQLAGAILGGPYALDLAVSDHSARAKGVKGPVVGRADILVAPDIEAGNILYKTLVYFAGLEIASVVIGARVPIIVTSRGDSDMTKHYSIALAALMSGKNS